MYRTLTFIENDETDLIIMYLERVQLGYSDLILLAMENGWSEELILADIEDTVRECLDDKTEAYIKKISHDIFWHMKICNNY